MMFFQLLTNALHRVLLRAKDVIGYPCDGRHREMHRHGVLCVEPAAQSAERIVFGRVEHAQL